MSETEEIITYIVHVKVEAFPDVDNLIRIPNYWKAMKDGSLVVTSSEKKVRIYCEQTGPCMTPIDVAGEYVDEVLRSCHLVNHFHLQDCEKAEWIHTATIRTHLVPHADPFSYDISPDSIMTGLTPKCMWDIKCQIASAVEIISGQHIDVLKMMSGPFPPIKDLEIERCKIIGDISLEKIKSEAYAPHNTTSKLSSFLEAI